MQSDYLVDRLSLGKIVQIRERLIKAQASGARVFRFESGDPNFALAPSALEALVDAARAGKTHYIPNAGIPELRRALADKLRSKNHIPVGSEQNVFVTNGAMHALFSVCQCILRPGDEVIVPEPEWTEAIENIKLARGVPVPVRLRPEHGYQYRPADISAAITPRTAAIFVNSPHNPTGAVLSRDTLSEIVDLARSRRLMIISDEAYEDVIYEPNEHISAASLAPDYADKIISVYSFSKSHAMSGLRVGYAVVHAPPIMDRMQKVLRCTINGVNSVAQWAALAAVQSGADHIKMMRAAYAERRQLMFSALQGIDGLVPFFPQGAFYVWADLHPAIYQRLGVRDADALSSFLADRGIGSSPGDAFGDQCADAIRFAFSCSTEMVRHGARELRNALTAGG